LDAGRSIELLWRTAEGFAPHQARHFGFGFSGGQANSAVLVNDLDKFTIQCAFDKLEQILSKVCRGDGHIQLYLADVLLVHKICTFAFDQCTIIAHTVLSSFFMNQLQVVPPSGLGAAHDGSNDANLVQLWLSMKTSGHTRRAYRAEAERFFAFVDKPLSWVTLTDLQAWADQLGQGTLKSSSQNRALTAIKSLLSFAQETGYVSFNVGAAVKLRPSRDSLAQRILEESEVARLIDAAQEGRNRVLLKLLYVSGVRVSEVCGLKWCDALTRQEGGQITVFGKGGKTRTVLLKPKVWQQLLSIKGQATAIDPIFPSRKGGGALDVSQVRRTVYAAAKRAGLEQKVSPHWMRHAHASHALDRSAPIHLVQATLGHASVSTTGRYLHARPSESSSFYLPD
jgi:site-specific recombinase XerD